MREEGATEALALVGGIDADERQIPVRLVRVNRAHLLEEGGDRREVPGSDGARDHRVEGGVVDLGAGRQPEGGALELLRVGGGAEREGGAAEDARELGERLVILLRIGIDPPRGRVVRERPRDDGDGAGRLGRLDGFDATVGRLQGRLLLFCARRGFKISPRRAQQRFYGHGITGESHEVSWGVKAGSDEPSRVEGDRDPCLPSP